MSTPDPTPEILVVDDDRELLEVLLVIFTEEGYHVTVATGGRDALARLRAGLRPSMILLDLMMPGMNGWAFREALLADPELARIPVVVLSGDHRSLTGDPPPAVSLCLPKPIDLSTLLDAVKESAATTRP